MAEDQWRNASPQEISLGGIEENNYMLQWKKLDKAKLNFIGAKPLNEIQLAENSRYIRFRKLHTFNGGEEIIEVIDTSALPPILKHSIVSTEYDCHPLAQAMPINAHCFQLEHQSQKYISPHDVNALMDLLITSEFWELDQIVSAANMLNGYVYDGEDWQIDAIMAQYDYHQDNMITISHSVERHSIQRFQSIREIGRFMQDLAENTYVFP